MGLFEVLPHLWRLWRLRRALLARARAAGIRLFVGVDAPGFNLSLARGLHASGVRCVQVVSPQVWAWRSWRVAGMARTLERVLCLLPFEPEFYAGRGLAAEFVGHPLADQIPLEPDRAAARAALGLAATDTVVALLPGSRRGEVERLAFDFIAAAAWLHERRPGLRFVLPAANAAARRVLDPLVAASPVPIRVLDGEARAALTACDVALVASGTATLEALLCKRPMVVAYRIGAATAWLLRRLKLVKLRYFSQPNLLAGAGIVPEVFQEEVTAERLGTELLGWLGDPARVGRYRAEGLAIHERLRRDAAARAAEAVLAALDAATARAR